MTFQCTVPRSNPNCQTLLLTYTFFNSFYLDISLAGTMTGSSIPEVITLHITLNPQITDRGLKPTFAPQQYFLMDPIELDFAYHTEVAPDTSDTSGSGSMGGDSTHPKIEVDGLFVSADKYVRPTPFTQWMVEVVRSSSDPDSEEGKSLLANVKGARLELICEFS